MTSEKLRQVEQAGPQLTHTLDEQQREELRDKIMRRHERERVAKLTILAAAILILVFGAAWIARGALVEQPHDSAAALKAGALAFEDGSLVQPRPGGRVSIVSQSSEAVRVNLQEGSARFVITPDRTRRFEVEVDDVTVRVLGTVFVVERARDKVRVEVERGRVEVIGPAGQQILERGQISRQPLRQPATDDGEVVLHIETTPAPAPAFAPAVEELDPKEKELEERAPAVKPKAERRPSPPKPREVSWKDAQAGGDYKRAATLLPDASEFQHVADLMLAADTMRLAGSPRRALPYLERVADSFPDDPRAPLAQFTRARLMLDEFGQPARAARIFARIHEAYPNHGIAEHAHAREVEAWSKAGESGRAHSAARDYIERYPAGPRARAVRLHGELRD